MKWLRTLVIFDKGGIVHSSNWQAIHKSYVRSISRIDFPEGAGTLTLRRKTQQSNKQWSRNGVGYLKRRFIDKMVNDEHWESEVDLDLGNDRPPSEVHLYPGMTPHSEPIASNFGGFDFVTTVSPGVHVAIEWETGNISSSHRSMNKLAIALAMGKIQAGVLIVPSRNLYEHLTDRIGNINELSGYLSMWKSLGTEVECGLLAISVVEHDHLTDNPDFPYLPVGNDGRSHNGDS
jgi:hypothetical protein